MKILWLANTPCGAGEKLPSKTYGGGWLNSLEEQLVSFDEIELSVCFYWKKRIKPFHYKKTTYYPIPRINNRTLLNRIYNILFNKIYNDKKNIEDLKKIIEIVQPDLIHIHGTEYNFGLIQTYTKIPIVISIQGILNAIKEKYFSGIPLCNTYWNEGLIPKLFRNSIIPTKNKIKKRADNEKIALLKAKHIIGRTDWDKRVTSILAPNSTYYIGNEILRDSFYEKPWNKEQTDNPVQIVTTISNGLYKGLETIIKTAKILTESSSFQFKWIIIGQNEKSYIAKLMKHYLNADYQKLSIEFVGVKNEVEVKEIYINSDIYCQASHIENSPNSLCEAMLLGMPVIASFAGGTSSLLKDKTEGIIVQEGEPYSLAGAIKELVDNFQLARMYGKAAREKAIERHDKNKISNKILSIYNSIIKARTKD